MCTWTHSTSRYFRNVLPFAMWPFHSMFPDWCILGPCRQRRICCPRWGIVICHRSSRLWQGHRNTTPGVWCREKGCTGTGFGGLLDDLIYFAYLMVQAFQIVDQCPEHRADRSQIIIRPAVEIPEIHAKAEGLVPDPVLDSGTLLYQEIPVPGQIPRSPYVHTGQIRFGNIS